MSVFIDMNSEKKYVVLFGGNSQKVPELLDMNAEENYVALFGSNSESVRIACLIWTLKKVLFDSNYLKFSGLFDMNS